MWVIFDRAVAWLMDHKEVMFLAIIVCAIVAVVTYIHYLHKELTEKESQLAVMNSQLRDQEVLQEIKQLLGQNDVFQIKIDNKLSEIAELDSDIHELNVEHSNDMVSILALKSFSEVSGDVTEHPSVFDVCEPPCHCVCD